MTGWPLHSNGTTLHGPFLGPDGLMYLTYNLGHYQIDTREGRRMEGPGGRVWRMRPDGSGLEWIVGGGYDNGIEMVFNAAGEMFRTITYYRNPRLGERDALLHYVEGGVYPKVTPIVNKYKRTGDRQPRRCADELFRDQGLFRSGRRNRCAGISIPAVATSGQSIVLHGLLPCYFMADN